MDPFEQALHDLESWLADQTKAILEAAASVPKPGGDDARWTDWRERFGVAAADPEVRARVLRANGQLRGAMIDEVQGVLEVLTRQVLAGLDSLGEMPDRYDARVGQIRALAERNVGEALGTYRQSVFARRGMFAGARRAGAKPPIAGVPVQESLVQTCSFCGAPRTGTLLVCQFCGRRLG